MRLPIYSPPPPWNGLWSSTRMPLRDFRLQKRGASENGGSGRTRHGRMRLSVIAVATSRWGRRNEVWRVEGVVQNQEWAFNSEQITTNVITWISWSLGCHVNFTVSRLSRAFHGLQSHRLPAPPNFPLRYGEQKKTIKKSRYGTSGSSKFTWFFTRSGRHPSAQSKPSRNKQSKSESHFIPKAYPYQVLGSPKNNKSIDYLGLSWMTG